jgi:hypothetical protein
MEKMELSVAEKPTVITGATLPIDAADLLYRLGKQMTGPTFQISIPLALRERLPLNVTHPLIQTFSHAFKLQLTTKLLTPPSQLLGTGYSYRCLIMRSDRKLINLPSVPRARDKASFS